MYINILPMIAQSFDKILDDNIHDKTFRFMKEFLTQSSLAIKLSKRSIDDGYNVDLKSALNIEFREYIKTLDSEDRNSALKKFNKN